MICQYDPTDPESMFYGECGPPCRSDRDCVSWMYCGTCTEGRCAILNRDDPGTCRTDEDCLGISPREACVDGYCLPRSCDDTCDCPLWPGSGFVCSGGRCVQPPGDCVTFEDCPCANGGQRYCVSSGICVPFIS
jgi:hypothetical protein